MMAFPGPFQVHAWKKQNKTRFRDQLPDANITIHEKKKRAWRKHVKIQKTSLSLEKWNFFGNCPVMLWKKTKVLCKRHVMTQCTSMLRNSRWDKLKWHLWLRWRLHVKLAGIISPRSENSTLRFPLDCRSFGWNERDAPAPRAELHRALSSAHCYRLPQELQELRSSRTHAADGHRWIQAQETLGVTNAGMRFSFANSQNGSIVLWNSGWNVWKSKMELILSEYLISIRVVDYCSLGLLSKNKIKKERVPIGKYIFTGVRECKKSQLTNAEHWQELKQMLTVARGWNWMSLTQISSTASQQKKAISPNAAACRDLIQDRGVQGFEALGTCRGSSGWGQAKCSMCFPVWTWTGRAATNLKALITSSL